MITGWTLLMIGGLVGVIPTMMFQVWNGASLLGALIAVGGAWNVMKGVSDV